MRNIEGSEHPAIRLAIVIARLRSRLREEGRASLSGFSLSQLAVMKRLHRHGNSTASELATAEHVTQQAIAQVIAGLKRKGYILAQPDPEDKRKTLVSLSPSGEELIQEMLATRDAWLVRAIDTVIPDDEREEFEQAITFLERIADSRTGPKTDLR